MTNEVDFGTIRAGQASQLLRNPLEEPMNDGARQESRRIEFCDGELLLKSLESEGSYGRPTIFGIESLPRRSSGCRRGRTDSSLMSMMHGVPRSVFSPINNCWHGTDDARPVPLYAGK